MPAYVQADYSQIQGSLRRLHRHIQDSNLVMRVLGLALRNYVRETITMGGRKRPHAPLSWWTRQRTGKRKPLKGVEKYIHFTSNPEVAEVFFARQGISWTIEMHHRGYKIPARTGVQVMPLAKGGFIFMKKTKATSVPAREIWPTLREVRDLTSDVATRWIREGAQRSWRP